MALELFINFERSGNNGTFYREISSQPYEAVLTVLADFDDDLRKQKSNVVLSENYLASYSLNSNSTFVEFNIDEHKPHLYNFGFEDSKNIIKKYYDTYADIDLKKLL